MERYRFNYRSFSDLEQDIVKLGLDLPLESDLSVLQEAVSVGDGQIPNRLAIQPMEGCDSLPDGSPSELTERRYIRYAQGGCGLIWFEAVAVSNKGRGKPSQLHIHESTLNAFTQLVDKTRNVAMETNGINPYLVLQLTHAGRYGNNKIIVVHEEELDRKAKVDPDKAIVTDEELLEFEDDMVKAALLAKQAGFDAVDIKSCHRYLISENLGAHTRSGQFGGSYQNRTRLVKNIIRKIKDQQIDIEVTVRLNSYDAVNYPYGWGTDVQGHIDLTEPKQLVAELHNLGLSMINITASTPYLAPHLSRPYDQPTKRGYPAPEHPLIGVNRMIHLARELQEVVPDMVIVGTGYSWLRHYAPQVAAGVAKAGWAKVLGFGRQAFAYPDFANDIINQGEMVGKKVCVSCSKCSELKAAARLTGCVVRDNQVYVPPYVQLIKEMNV